MMNIIDIKHKIISNKLINSKLSRIIVLFLKRTRNRQSLEEIENRKDCSIFDYEQLSKKIPTYPFYHVGDCNLYGLGKVVERAGYNPNKTEIEHGFILGSVIPKHIAKPYCNTILTLSEYRKKHLTQKIKNKNIIVIGNYMKYVDSLLTKIEFDKIKSKIGKTLLIFPSHSIDAATASYDKSDFIKFIDNLSKDFDTTLVCCYWKDIELGYHKVFEEKGYKIVTAGYAYDQYFLNRLRSIIELSDLTASNEVGSHLFYCRALKKQHLTYPQEVSFNYRKKNEYSVRDKSDWDSYYEDRNRILSSYSYKNEKNNSLEIEITDKLFGGVF